MTYPQPPDFTSGEPLAAHFAVRLSGGRLMRIATQGETAIKRIQQALNAAGIQAKPSAAAIRVGPIAVDGVFGYQTMEGLINYAAQLDRAAPGTGYGYIVERLHTDLSQHRIDALALRFALWLAYVKPNRDYAGAGFEDVTIPANARLPTWGQAPDDDRDAGGPTLAAVSWLEGVQPPPVPPARSADRAPVGTGQVARGAATPGVTTRTRQPTTQAQITTPAPGQQSGAMGMLEGDTWGVPNKALAAVGVGAALVLLYKNWGKPRRSRRRRSAPKQLGAGA